MVNAGSTAELERLKALSDRVNAFQSQATPTERGLPPLAAIAYGALQAIAPERAAQLRPEVERVRNLDIDQFNRERQRQAQDISAEADLTQAFTGAEGRQEEDLQQQQAVQGIFQSANTIIEGASQAAQMLAESGDPLERDLSKDVMRRVLMFRELVSSAQQAEPGAIGPQFVEAAMGEIQGIQGLLEGQRGFEQKRSLLREAQAGAMQRSQVTAAARMAAVQGAMQNKLFAKYAKDYGEMASYSPVIEQALAMASGGVGGPVAGMLPTAQARALDGLYSDLKTQVVFGEAGKAFTATERAELSGMIPTVTDTRTSQVASLQRIRERFQRKMEVIRRLAPGVESVFSGMGDVPIGGLAPDDAYMGDIDLGLLGIEEEE
jgi:hypothetical protein